MREQTKIKVGLVLDYVNEYIGQNGYPPSVREICAALGFKSTSTVHIYLRALEQEGKIVKAPSKPRTLRVMHSGTAAEKPSAALPQPQGQHSVQPQEQRAAQAQGHHAAQASKHAVPAGAGGRGQRQSVPFPPNISNFAARGKNRRTSGNSRLYNAATDADSETVHVPVVGRVTAGRPILAVENVEYTFPVPSFFVNNASVFMLRVEGDSMINAGIWDRDYILVRQQQTAENGEIVVALIDDEATVKTFYMERNRIRLQPENERYSPIFATNNCRVVGKVVGIFRKI